MRSASTSIGSISRIGQQYRRTEKNLARVFQAAGGANDPVLRQADALLASAPVKAHVAMQHRDFLPAAANGGHDG